MAHPAFEVGGVIAAMAAHIEASKASRVNVGNRRIESSNSARVFSTGSGSGKYGSANTRLAPSSSNASMTGLLLWQVAACRVTSADCPTAALWSAEALTKRQRAWPPSAVSHGFAQKARSASRTSCRC